MHISSEGFQKFDVVSHLQFFLSFPMTLLDVTGFGGFFPVLELVLKSAAEGCLQQLGSKSVPKEHIMSVKCNTVLVCSRLWL